MSLNDIRDEVHAIARSKGWHVTLDPRTFGDVIALIHSEASEALEEFRNGYAPQEIYYTTDNYGEAKPEGIPIELADIIIRVLDYCGLKRIDIQSAIDLKVAYNRTRPVRHGGKKI